MLAMQPDFGQAALILFGWGVMYFVAGAPMTGDANTWAARLEQGRDKLLTSALNGIGIMPAKGGQTQLTDEEVISAVDYMIRQIKQD